MSIHLASSLSLFLFSFHPYSLASNGTTFPNDNIKTLCIYRQFRGRNFVFTTIDEISLSLDPNQSSECGISPLSNQIGGGGLMTEFNQFDGGFMFEKVSRSFLHSHFQKSNCNSGICFSSLLSNDNCCCRLVTGDADHDLIRIVPHQNGGSIMGNPRVFCLQLGQLSGPLNGLFIRSFSGPFTRSFNRSALVLYVCLPLAKENIRPGFECCLLSETIISMGTDEIPAVERMFSEVDTLSSKAIEIHEFVLSKYRSCSFSVLTYRWLPMESLIWIGIMWPRAFNDRTIKSETALALLEIRFQCLTQISILKSNSVCLSAPCGNRTRRPPRPVLEEYISIIYQLTSMRLSFSAGSSIYLSLCFDSDYGWTESKVSIIDVMNP